MRVKSALGQVGLSQVGPGQFCPVISAWSYRSKQGCKDQESIQSSTTPGPGYQWESDKLTVDTTIESQEVSPFPAGDHKAHINRRAQRHSKHKTEQKYKRSTKEGPSWNGQQNILLEGLNWFNGANLTLNSDVDQDT